MIPFSTCPSEDRLRRFTSVKRGLLRSEKFFVYKEAVLFRLTQLPHKDKVLRNFRKIF